MFSFTCFCISVLAIGGAWYMLKDVPGGKVQKYTPNMYRREPMDVA